MHIYNLDNILSEINHLDLLLALLVTLSVYVMYWYYCIYILDSLNSIYHDISFCYFYLIPYYYKELYFYISNFF